MPRFVEPDEMVPPLLWLMSPEADAVNGYRFDAITWDTALDPAEAARKNARKADSSSIPKAPPGSNRTREKCPSPPP